MYTNKLQRKRKMYLGNLCNLFNTKIMVRENNGRIQSVNKIFIVNSSENGRLGKEYRPAPTSKRSKYVPISDAKIMADK
ncbi:hypothetical protein [Oceanobacillus profundus]|uniref:hypothetical protein n=1 Tax=Oceanobacillus sp. FSL W7-1309 TaxID=2954539 RepID=UPI0026E203D5|nr:hypothetical protein [Oceanobacillus profundus]